jgi:hypothetical protein
VIGESQLLVTLKTDPDPGTVDVVSLQHGRVTGAAPVAVAAPDGSLAPFGFASYPDGTALITLAHSNQDGLFRNGSFAEVVDAGQTASCWMTRSGKYVFVANTGSRTISRLIGTGSHVFVDSPIAANIATGGAPADIDADLGVLGNRPWCGPVSSVALHLQRFRGAHSGRGTDRRWSAQRQRGGNPHFGRSRSAIDARRMMQQRGG